jgi:serine/threonine-protein kinase
MVSGRAPFSGSTLVVVHAHAYDPPDFTVLPAALRPVVGSGLARDPAARCASAGALAQALRRRLGGSQWGFPSPGTAPPSPAQQRRGRSTPIWVWAVGAWGVKLAVGLGIALAALAGSGAARSLPAGSSASPTLSPTFTAMLDTAPPAPA